MKPLQQLLKLLFLIALPIAPLSAQQSDITGTYKYQSADAFLTLKLNQQGSLLAGTLSSSSGASFDLTGQIENGIGAGTCSDDEGSVFFEVYFIEGDLTFSLIEPDANNQPDYDKAQYLVFEKSTETGSPQDTPSPQATDIVAGKLGIQPSGQANNPSAVQSPSTTQAPAVSQTLAGEQIPATAQTPAISPSPANSYSGTQGNSNIGQGEVGDPSWGFKFTPPAGWVHQQTGEAVILGHNTIAGMILVIPHMSENMQQMQQEMMQGLQEGGSYLLPSGALQNTAQNILAGDYAGAMDGTQVKARGFGVLSPNGGGAYLIAVSTPEGLSEDLVGAAESITRNIQYFKVDVSDLARHFAGTWSHFTTNTSTWMTFHPDGTYSDEYEASYSGNLTDGAGTQTGNWGAMGQQGDRGRWTVRGTKDAGTIIVRKANGQEVYYDYRVNQKDGRKYYWEYYFNGDFYMKKEE
jgi:hypothetical protein